MIKKLSSLIVVAVFLLFSFGSVSAFPLFQGTATLPGTQFEDDDLDYFEDKDNNGIITEGDVLYSVIEFGQIVDLVSGNPAYTLNNASDELVALGTMELESIDNSGIWYFKEHNSIPIVQFYTGGLINLDILTAGSDPTLAQAKAAVTDGTHLWDFSIDDDPDTYWSFEALTLPAGYSADNPTQVATLQSSVKIGVANYQLNQVWGNDIFDPIYGFNMGGDGMVDLIGSADISGGLGLMNGAFARSDADAIVNPIPEPATMTLLGIGLLSLSAVARKRLKG